jgi:hypothetical protein
MGLWYGVLALSAVGAFVGCKRRARKVFFLVVVAAVWILLGALTNGNVGTVFRMRDMITPILLLFAAAGAVAIESYCEGARIRVHNLSRGAR